MPSCVYCNCNRVIGVHSFGFVCLFTWAENVNTNWGDESYTRREQQNRRGGLQHGRVKKQRFISPWEVTSRVRTRSLLLPTRMIGVCGWVSLRRSRSWAVRWKLRLSVTENTRTHTSHSKADRSWGAEADTSHVAVLESTFHCTARSKNRDSAQMFDFPLFSQMLLSKPHVQHNEERFSCQLLQQAAECSF